MKLKNIYTFLKNPYIVTIVFISLGAMLRIWPLIILENRTAWITFYPAVILASLYGGIYAGLLGASLSCIIVLFILPLFVGESFIQYYVDWLGMAVFFLTCTMISLITESMLREKNRVKKGNEKIKKLNEELESTNKELEAFSYSVSHDLRAPLRAINGYANMHEEDSSENLDDEGKRLLGVIQQNAKKMGNLIEDLLSFSKLGKKEIKKSNINMNVLVPEIFDGLNKTHNYNAEFKMNNLINIKADLTLMNQVISNLLSNALKYSAKKEKPVIEINSYIDKNKFVFFIKDNGAGFNMKYYDKLYGVFQRLHSSDEFEGIGVGLAIVKRIITKHGGEVWAEGKINEGATFYSPNG